MYLLLEIPVRSFGNWTKINDMKTIFVSFILSLGLISYGQNTNLEELWNLYMAGEYDLAIEKATPLYEKNPNDVDLNLILGRSYTDIEAYQTAIPFLSFVVNNDSQNSWRKAWALAYRGTSYFMLERFEESLQSYHNCVELNATKNSTNYAYFRFINSGLNPIYEEWEKAESDNFRFYFRNMSKADQKRFISIREKAFNEINGFFKSKLPKKIDFFVWDSKEDAKQEYNIKLGYSISDLCVVQSHDKQTIGHEMTHVISYHSADHIKTTRFINEGTAVCFDLSKENKLKVLKDRINADDSQISIKEYWNNGNKYPEQIIYPLAGLFVRELIEIYGREKFLEFFKDQSYANALLVFGDTLNALIQNFENKINS